MAYVDETYYTKVFHGEPVDSADFPALCERAGEMIEELTLYRLTPMTFPAMPEKVQECIKRAVCAQIEYLDANGGADLDNGADIQSAALGKFNYSRSAGANGSTEQSRFSPRAERILWPTGLTYKGGRC